jgi:hypothetical protein
MLKDAILALMELPVFATKHFWHRRSAGTLTRQDMREAAYMFVRVRWLANLSWRRLEREGRLALTIDETWQQLDALAAEEAARRKAKRRRDSGPIRFLEIAQLLFSRRTREKICEPVIDDLREDYLIARKLCRTKPTVAWAKFCFAWRAIVAFLECIRVATAAGIGKVVPAALKTWWTLLH